MDFYRKFFGELLAHQKRALKYCKKTKDYFVENNAWKVVKEWTQAEVVEFLYKWRDYHFTSHNQRLGFQKAEGQKWLPKRATRKSRTELVRTPIAFGVPVADVLASLKEDE